MGSKAPAAQTVTQKTELPAWLEDVTKQNLRLADEIASRPYQAYGGNLIAGFSPEQERAFSLISGNVGQTMPLYQTAASALTGASQYQPMNVTPGQMDFSRVGSGRIGFDRISPTATSFQEVGVNPADFERISSGQAGFERVSAPSFLQGDINAYMNPYISNVEEAAISRLQDASQQNLNQIASQAARAGAFGGSRQGVAEAVARGETARSAGELSAGLRSQAFNQAAALMQTDQGRAMQAALANQAAGMQTDQFNVESALRSALANQAAGMQTSQFNVESALRAGLANQAAGMQTGQFNAQQALEAQRLNQAAGLTAGQFNVESALRAALANQAAGLTSGQANLDALMRAQLANQSAGLQGAQLRAGAAGQLGSLAQAQQQAYLTDLAALESVGAQRQGLEQARLEDAYRRFMEQQNYPIEMLNLRLGATSATPYGTTQTRTQTGGPSGSNWLSGAGTALTGITAAMKFLPLLFGFSDERMKTDIEKVGKDDETGLTMYAYRYKGDPKSYPKVVGPMAQEVEKKYPEMVEERGGRKAVNLGFGPMRKGMA